jgi:hypothetical protein
LLTYLVIAAVAICAARNLLASIIIFTSFSVVVSVLWILLLFPFSHFLLRGEETGRGDRVRAELGRMPAL